MTITKLDCMELKDTRYSVYPYDGYNLEEILGKFYEAIKECNDLSFSLQEFNNWLISQGLTEEVLKQLTKIDWDNIVNSELYQSVIERLLNSNNRIEEVKNELSSQLDNIESETNEKIEEVKMSVNDVNKRIFYNTLYVDPNTGQFKSIKSALDYAIKNGVGKNNRYTICINNGVYNEKLNLVDGIDLVGSSTENTIITYRGTSYRQDDTINASCDCSIRNITIIQDSNGIQADLQNYPIHIDGNPQENMNVAIENVKAISYGEFSHHAIGIGLYGSQQIDIKNCHFESENKSAFYLHNQSNQSKRCSCYIKDSNIFSRLRASTQSEENSAFLLEDVGSNQIDEVKLINCEVFIPKGVDIRLRKHPSFEGDRNTLYCGLVGCTYNTYDYPTDGGTILDFDNAIRVSGIDGDKTGNVLFANPKDINPYGKTINAMVSNVNDGIAIGVGVTYCGVVFCVTKGIVQVIARDTTAGQYINSTSDGGAKGCNKTDNGIIGIALKTNGYYSKIPCLLI